MNTGWIKLHRSLMHWEWADVPEMMALWIHLILSASYEDREYHGAQLEAGQLVTTYGQLAQISGLSIKQVRICMARLVESNQITTERAGKRQLVTISNYKQFQELENEKGQGNGTEKAAKGQQKGTERAEKGHAIINKEIKKVKKERSKELIIPQPPLQGAAPEKTEPKAKPISHFDYAFDEIFRKLTGDSFAWAKRENVAVNTMVGKITKMIAAKKFKDENGREPTEDERIETEKTITPTEKEAALRWFLEALYQTGDQWIRANFTPYVINTKFNEFYLTIKNQHNGKQRNNTSGNPTGVSADYLQRVAAELAG